MAVELKTMELKKREETILAETKKEVKDLSLAEQPTKGRQLFDFLADVKAELSKINWTTPEELKTYTKIVIGATFCFGMGVYFIDLLIQFVLGTLESTIRLIGG